MRSPIKPGAALAGGALAVTASLTAVVTGIASTTSGPFSAPAAAAELSAFADCEELLEWYVEQALPSVGPWGLDGGIVHAGPGWEVSGPDSSGAVSTGAAGPSVEGRSVGASPDRAATASATGTNVQEAGVEEPDRAKTDGDLVVHLRDRTLVVTDVSGVAPREVGTLQLPDDVASPELLLSGTTVLVLGSEESFHPLPVEPLPRGSVPRQAQGSGVVADWVVPGWGGPDRSRLLEVSLEDPTSPTVVSDRTFGGSLVSARAHGDPSNDASGGTVRLVLRTDRPTLDFVSPDRERTPEEARRLNRELVRTSSIDDWLPSVHEGQGTSEPLVDCADVRHPTDGGAGFATVTVVTLPASAPEPLTTTAVTAEGDTVYSSADRLYLATPESGRRTAVHAFALDGTATTYVASGSVDGVVRDRWALDEVDGFLRLAVAHVDREWTTRDNGVTLLRERSGALEVAGAVKGLGPEEEIKSVRWLDDLAVVVTFRQTDPLYTVDLTDPRRPRALGQLKIPGFSEYLHPVGGDRLLGVGHDATADGEVRGAQLSLFDIAVLAQPERVDTLSLGGRDVRPVAGWEPRALTWLPDPQAVGTGTALTAVADDATGKAWLAEVTVGAADLSTGRRWPLPQWEADSGRALPLTGDRVAVVGSAVEVVNLG
jgi:hypothetical protein